MEIINLQFRNIKKYSAVLLFFLAATISYAQTHTGNLFLNNQIAIDTFNFTEITGNLTIQSGSITNLDSLSELTNIGGNLAIQNNTSLTSLNGLEMLDSIGGTLSITGNTMLTDFCAVSSLIGDGNVITSTEYTVNMNGYNPPYEHIQNGDFCRNIDGLFFDRDLILATQQELDNFSYTAVFGNITVEETTQGSILNINGLSSLTTLDGTLTVTNNTALVDFCGISSIVGDALLITNTKYAVSGNAYNPPYGNVQNTNLCSNADGSIFIGDLTLETQLAIDNFSYTAVLGNITVEEASSGTILNINGLSSLTTLDGTLTITSNDLLANFCGISSIVGDALPITNTKYAVSGNAYNPSYTDIQDGTNMCSSSVFTGDFTISSQAIADAFLFSEVTGNLTIRANTVSNLDSLYMLTTVGGALAIENNMTLTSLAGLEILDSIGGTLSITGNPNLTNFCAISSLIGDGNVITSTEYTVNMNGYNPPYEHIQNGDFCRNIDGLFFDRDLILATQQELDNFSYTAVFGNITVEETTQGSIRNINGLSGLTTLDGTLTVTNNTALVDFCGISSIVGDALLITNTKYAVSGNAYNPTYGNVQNTNLCSNADGSIFTGDLTLETQLAIDNFSYTAVLGNITVEETTPGTILNINGLSGLTILDGTLTITSNDLLANFCGISSIVGDALLITNAKYAVSENAYNPSYTDIQDANTCSSSVFTGDFTISSQAIADAFLFSEVTGNLTIRANTVSYLDSLYMLTTVGGALAIENNMTLTSLAGLEILNAIGGTLSITGNPNLTNFCAISSLIGDGNVITSTEYTVNTNGYNPTYEHIQNGDLCSNADGSIFTGDLTLTTQLAIDNFSYTAVFGNITVQEAAPNTIFSIRNLGGLTLLTGNLTITNNASLTTFCDLSSLVGNGNVVTNTQYAVSGNANNPDFTAVQNPSTCFLPLFTGDLTVTSQAAVDGFGFTEVRGNLTIGDGNANNIRNLLGLSGLLTVDGNITIQANDSLWSLDGLENLTSADALSITDNANLSSYCAVASLVGDASPITSMEYTVSGNNYNPTYTAIQTTDSCFSTFVFGDFNFDAAFDHPSTRNQDNLNALGTRIETFGYTGIIGNVRLGSFDGPITSLEPLENITYISGELFVQRANLRSLRGLDSLTEVGGNLIFEFIVIGSLSGLEALTKVGGDLNLAQIGFFNNNGVVISFNSLEVLDNLTEIGGDLVLSNRISNVTSFRGLSSLTKIGGNLSLRVTDFSSVDGLSSLTEIGGNLNLLRNNLITDLCYFSSFVGDDKQITRGEYSVTLNGYNPSYEEIQSATTCFSVLFTGDYDFISQADVDEFASFGYTEITGDVRIIGVSSPPGTPATSDITNLDSLTSLTRIGGGLRIANIPSSLSSLSGLENLVSLGGQLAVVNTRLTDFCPLATLVSNGVSAYQVRDNAYNPSEANILDPNFCNSEGVVFGDLTLNNQADIDTFNTRIVTGNLIINEATSGNITNLDSLRGLIQVGNSISIQSNDSLRSLSGLEDLTGGIRGNLTISSNPSLTSLSGLEMLDSIGGTLTLFSNPSLTSLSGLDALIEIGGNIDVNTNTSLTSLSGLEALTTINGILQIISNPSLTSLSGLGDLTEIGGNLNIQSNDSLTSLSGLGDLTEVRGNMDIRMNNSLTSLSGLEMLDSIGGSVTLFSNPSLTSLSGLEMLESIGGTLAITGNTALTDFCTLSSLIGDGNQIASGEYTVSSNGYNPSYAFAQDPNLCSNPDGSIFEGDLTLTSQVAIDTFTYRAIIGNLSVEEASVGDITNLNGLNGLMGLDGNLSIQNNEFLSNYCDISHLVGATNIVDMAPDYQVSDNNYNPSYTAIQSPDNCFTTSYMGTLTFTSQATVDRFRTSGITAITGDLVIMEDVVNNITNLDSLIDLTMVGGNLRIENNTALTSLTGLEQVDSINGNLSIMNNAALVDFCVASTLVGDANQITSSEYIVSGNGYNPSYAFVQDPNLCSNADGSIFEGDLTLTSQVAIDTFTYRAIIGNLSVEEASVGDITNLNGLNGLMGLDGNLSIQNNEFLSNYCDISHLVGATNIVDMAPDYQVSSNNYNPSYTAIQSPDSCFTTSYTGTLTFTSQATVDRFRASGITAITGDLVIMEDVVNNITNLDSLIDLTMVGGNVTISTNAALATLSGIANLQVNGNLSIENNAALATLSGIANLQVNGNLSIENNTALTSLTGLEQVDSINGISIMNNAALVDFCIASTLVGDANQITRSEYTVSGNGYNPSYELIQESNFCSNADGSFFDGDLTLTSQVAIDTFTYRAITGNLIIEEATNDDIVNLDSLENLMDVIGDLQVRGNRSLPSLNGLVASRVRGNVEIDNNTALTSLVGLEMIDSIDGNLIITNNAALFDFCIVASLVGDGNQITDTEYTVSGNGYNPTYTLVQNPAFCDNTDGRIFVGDLRLASQAAIDMLNSSYRIVTGNVIIEETTTNDITNLDSLENLVEVFGNLEILENDSLMSLSGLRAIASVDGQVRIINNAMLTSLQGLDSLETVADLFLVQGNTSLSSLTGFPPKLDSIGGNLRIYQNSSLTSLSGLNTILRVGQHVEIDDNDRLTSLQGLEMIDSIGGDLVISNNNVLVDFCAAATFIGDANQITDTEYTVSGNGYNPTYKWIQDARLCSNADGRVFVGDFNLTEFAQFAGFNYKLVTGSLNIEGGPGFHEGGGSLISLTGLIGVGGTLRVANNVRLDYLTGLTKVEFVGGDLVLFNQLIFASLRGLDSLKEIGGTFHIINTGLRSLASFPPQLTSVGGLRIVNHGNLLSLTGLSIPRIVGNLEISNNVSFRSLAGLDMIDSIGGDLIITNNPALNDFCIASTLVGDANQITGTEYTVSDNGYNPSYGFIQDPNLCSNADGRIFDGDVTLERQTAIDSFAYGSITGNLTIEETMDGNILNLDSLENLINLGGNLQISGNTALTSLQGLDSLAIVEGTYRIQNNSSLTSLAGFSPRLTLIGDSLVIEQNNSLMSLTGLSIPRVAGNIAIDNNTSLTSLVGLEMIDTIGGDLIITNNEALIDFCIASTLVGDGNDIMSDEYRVSDNGYNPSFEEIQRSHRCSTNPPVVVATLQNVTTRSTVPFATINVAPAFSDPNRDTLTYTATSSDESIITVAVTDSTLTLTEVSTGMVTITVTATDDVNLSVSDVFMAIITPNNPPVVENPLAAIESVSGRAFETIDLSATFSDPDGDALTYTVASNNTAIVTAALNGTTLTLTETGKGMATITVTASDGIESVSSAFMVTITNTAPTVATALTDVAIESGAGFAAIDLSATFSDENGDALSYTAMSDNETVVTVSVSGDTLTLTEVGTGRATITVTASDAFGLSVDTSFMVAITTNTAPTVATALTDVAIESGAGFAAIDLSATFSDENGDALSYTAMSDNETVVTVSVSGDTLTLTEVGTGTATITVTASDAFGLSVDTSFMVAITANTANTAPTVATALTDVAIESGAGFATIDLSATFSDPDGDALTYTVASSDAAIVTAVLSSTTLTLTEVGTGTATITVTASDGTASVSSVFMVTITTNTAPIRTPLDFPAIPPVSVGFQLEPAVNLTPFFSDPDGDALTFTASTTDASVATVSIVEPSSVTLTAIGTGTTTITVTATDPGGLSVSETVTITVVEPPLGIADTDILALYPNPSSGVFQLSRTVDVVRVYDMSGRLVYRARNIKQLDLTSNPAGQYLVEVRVGKEIGRYTIIRE